MKRRLNPPRTRRALGPVIDALLRLCLVAALLGPVPTTAQCNTPPTATADSATTPGNQPLWTAPLANDTDPDGQPLSLTVLSEDCPGTVTEDPAGLLIFTPMATSNSEQICSIIYRVTDGAGSSDTAEVTITVLAVPPAIFADDFESGNVFAWSGVE